MTNARVSVDVRSRNFIYSKTLINKIHSFQDFSRLIFFVSVRKIEQLLISNLTVN